MGFGSDFSAVDDLDSNWTFLEGDASEAHALGQSFARRFSTPRGALSNLGDPSYGEDLRAAIGSTDDPNQMIQRIEAEGKKDRRVRTCTATINVLGPKNSQIWHVQFRGTTATGPFRLTLAVSAVTVQLLSAGQ